MAKLLLNGAGGQAQELPLKSGVNRVGRISDNDIQIEHPSVSSHHCEVTAAGDSVIVKDLGSTNGTFVDGSPVQEACLVNGQRLQLGSVELVLDGATSQAPVASQAPRITHHDPSTPNTLVPAVPVTARPRLAVASAHHSPPAASVQLQSQSAQVATPARPAPVRNPLQPDRAHAEAEARSKMLWGDPPEDVTKFLMMQGYSADEASTLSAALLRERVKMIRAKGTRKILTGFGLMCVPLGTLLVMLHMGALMFQILGITCAVGLWGAWMCLKGTFMVVAPKSEPGDIAD